MIPLPIRCARAAPLRAGGVARAGLLAALLASAAGLLASAAGARAALAVEFAVPPGQNLGMQEDILRERDTRVAKDLAGDKVVSVVANVAYVRMEQTRAASSERIKLPGLNNFVATSGELQVSPEFVRLRQVVVVVSDELAGRVPAIERDLRAQAELDPGKGDRLEVVTVATAGSRLAPRPGEPPGEGRRKGEEPGPLAKDKWFEAEPVPSDTDPLREPKSTLYLINARAAYFRGDYNQALDQIMQSIHAKPDNPQAYAMLGSLYFAMNWKNLALKYWEKALAQDPGNRELELLVTQLRTAQN